MTTDRVFIPAGQASDETVDNFTSSMEICRFGQTRFYIVGEIIYGNMYEKVYLRKDLSLSTSCGVTGFYDSVDEARKMIKMFTMELVEVFTFKKESKIVKEKSVMQRMVISEQ